MKSHQLINPDNNVLNRLPTEILFHVFGFLGTKEWLTIARTNNFFYEFIQLYCKALLSSPALGINQEVIKKLKEPDFANSFYQSKLAFSITLLTSILRIPNEERKYLTVSDIDVLIGDKTATEKQLQALQKYVETDEENIEIQINQNKIVLYLLLGNHYQLCKELVEKFGLRDNIDKKRISIYKLNLSYYDFSRLNLKYVKFREAHFHCTRFVESKLDHAYFNYCTMSKVDFSAASLIKTKFEKNDITDKINLTAATIFYSANKLNTILDQFQYEHLLINMTSLNIDKRIQLLPFFFKKYSYELHKGQFFIFFKWSTNIKEMARTSRYYFLLNQAASDFQKKLVIYALLLNNSATVLQNKIIEYLGYSNIDTMLRLLKNSITQDINGDTKEFMNLQEKILLPLNKNLELSSLTLSYEWYDREFQFSRIVENFLNIGIELTFTKLLLQRIAYFTDQTAMALKHKVLEEIAVLERIKFGMFDFQSNKNQKSLKFYGKIIQQTIDTMPTLVILHVLMNDIELKELHLNITANCNDLLKQFLGLKAKRDYSEIINAKTTAHFQQILLKVIEAKLDFDIEKISTFHIEISKLKIEIDKKNFVACERLLENICEEIGKIRIENNNEKELKVFKLGV